MSGATAEVLPTAPAPDLAAIPTAHEKLSLRTIALFSSPIAGEGFMQMLTSLYLLKYTTDVLGLAPATMGSILLLGRIWDAVSDPLVGLWSDRTHTTIGRRRPWILAAAIPMSVSFVAIWAAPVSLGTTAVTAWVAVAIMAYYTCRTAFGVPHDALGAALTPDYHDRNRLFGIRRAFFGVGAILVFVALGGFLDGEDPRGHALRVTTLAAVAMAVAALGTGLFVHERPEHLGRGSRDIASAWRHVAANPHARILLGVFFLQQVGTTGVTMMAAYYAEYVLMDAGAFVRIMGSLFVSSVLSIPLWIALGRRFDKKRLLVTSMVVVGAVLTSLGFLGEGDSGILLWVGISAGIAIGGLDVLFPSVQADVIDYDEAHTGERKEGVYFAAWHFSAKTAMGLAALIGGIALQSTGFVPNEIQTAETRDAIRATMSLIPAVTYGAGVLLFCRFGLTREEHAAIRRTIADRVS